MLITNPDATQTAAEETRLDSCNRSQKIKTATCSDWSFLYVHKEWIVTKKKKGTVLVKEEKWAKPSWSNGNAVMFYTISSVLSFSPIDLITVFGYSIVFFKFKWPTTNWVKQLQRKPFSMEDVRSLKTLGLPQNYHVQISSLLMFEIKTEKKKKTFLKHLNVAIHSRSGCHFFLWAPYWRVLLSAVFLLPVGWMASC